MSVWESSGKSDEWYTPAFIFEALGERFDLDVASPPRATHVPCDGKVIERGRARRAKAANPALWDAERRFVGQLAGEA